MQKRGGGGEGGSDRSADQGQEEEGGEGEEGETGNPRIENGEAVHVINSDGEYWQYGNSAGETHLFNIFIRWVP